MKVRVDDSLTGILAGVRVCMRMPCGVVSFRVNTWARSLSSPDT